MDGFIWDSRGQHAGYLRGMEAFNLGDEKLYDVDGSGNLVDPRTKEIRGHLQPLHPSLPPDKSADTLFRWSSIE
jgi:hypothetical protein